MSSIEVGRHRHVYMLKDVRRSSSCCLWFVYFWLCWVLAADGLSSSGTRGPLSSCCAWPSRCRGCSFCGARALGCRASVVGARGLGSWGFQALEQRLGSRGSRASLLHCVWGQGWTRVSCIGRWILHYWATREAHLLVFEACLGSLWKN